MTDSPDKTLDKTELPDGWRWLDGRGAGSSTSMVFVTQSCRVRIEGSAPVQVVEAVLRRFGVPKAGM